MIVRKFSVGESQMPAVGRRSRVAVEEQFPEITWEHSHVAVEDDGLVKTFCVYDAPTLEIVEAHAKELGEHTVESVHEIVGTVTPDDFPG
jgi:hypothetical protein